MEFLIPSQKGRKAQQQALLFHQKKRTVADLQTRSLDKYEYDFYSLPGVFVKKASHSA